MSNGITPALPMNPMPVPVMPPLPRAGQGTQGALAAGLAEGVSNRAPASIHTLSDARRAVAAQLGRLGLGTGMSARGTLEEVYRGLGIDGTRGATPERLVEVKRYVAWVQRVASSPRGPRKQKLVGTVLASQIPSAHGARAGFYALSGTRGFWHRVRPNHISQIVGHFQRAGSSQAVRVTAERITKLLGHRMFLQSTDQGKANALTDLDRTARLLPYQPRMIKDTTKAFRAALALCRTMAGTERGARGLADRTLSAYERIRDHYFEPVGPHDRTWNGEALRFHLFGTGDLMRQAYDLQRREDVVAHHCPTNGSRRTECRVIQ